MRKQSLAKGEFNGPRMYVEPDEVAAPTPEQVKVAACTVMCSVHTTSSLAGLKPWRSHDSCSKTNLDGN